MPRNSRETPVSPSQSLDTRDGAHTLTATVKDSWQLGFWLLSQHARARMLSYRPTLKRRSGAWLRDLHAASTRPGFTLAGHLTELAERK